MGIRFARPRCVMRTSTYRIISVSHVLTDMRTMPGMIPPVMTPLAWKDLQRRNFRITSSLFSFVWVYYFVESWSTFAISGETLHLFQGEVSSTKKKQEMVRRPHHDDTGVER